MRTARTKPLVLVVDDDLSMRLLANEALSGDGFDVIEADSGESALEEFRKAPDAVLLDVMMDGIDGHEVCRRLRTLPGGKTVPILMMTGRDDMTSIDAAYHAGATDFITKPVPYALLPHRVRYLLRAATAFREAHDGAQLLARAQRLARIAHWEVTLPSRELRWSEEAREIFGIPLEHPERGSSALLSWVHPEDRAAVAMVFDPPRAHHLDFRMILPDGRERAVHQEAELLTELDTDQPRVVGVVQDMTERRRAEHQALQLAYYDSLTGLPNRVQVRGFVQMALATAERRGHQLAVFAIDLDHLRRVNDLHGHDFGDKLLIELAARMHQAVVGYELLAMGSTVETHDVRNKDDSLVGRAGGDEFVIALSRVRSGGHAAAVASRILQVVSAPYACDGVEESLTVSIGIATFPESGRTADDLFERADAAMYHAKEQGRNSFQFFDAALQQRAQRRMEIERGLRAELAAARAGAKTGLELHYQPKIALPSLRTTGVEGLLRWRSEKLGPISPLEFITIAEDSDLIIELGTWVLRSACATAMAELRDTTIAINISPRQFREPGFVQLVAETLAATGMPAQRLELEITEGVVMQDSDVGQRVLAELKALGVGIVLDDFGTGYSSLSYLLRFPIDTLKIDRSFVINLPNPMNESVIAAIVALARSLHIALVVEGVETEAQLRHFHQYGELEIQGYYFSRPLPAPQLKEWLARGPHAPM